MASRKNTPATPSVITLSKLLTIKEVAHSLNVSVRTVHAIVEAEQFDHSRAVAA
jgi:hypothetical protein